MLFIIRMLLADQGARLVRRRGQRLLGGRHGQRRAFLEQVDVVGHEGIRVHAQDRQQGLVQRGAGRTIGTGDAADHGAGAGLDHLGAAGRHRGRGRSRRLGQHCRCGRQAQCGRQQQGRSRRRAHVAHQGLEHGEHNSITGRVQQARSHQEAGPCKGRLAIVIV